MQQNPNGSVLSNQPPGMERPPQQQYPNFGQYPPQQYPQQAQPMYSQQAYPQQQQFMQGQIPQQQPQQSVLDISSLQLMIEQYLQFYYTDDEIIRE